MRNRLKQVGQGPEGFEEYCRAVLRSKNEQHIADLRVISGEIIAVTTAVGGKVPAEERAKKIRLLRAESVRLMLKPMMDRQFRANLPDLLRIFVDACESVDRVLISAQRLAGVARKFVNGEIKLQEDLPASTTRARIPTQPPAPTAHAATA